MVRRNLLLAAAAAAPILLGSGAAFAYPWLSLTNAPVTVWETTNNPGTGFNADATTAGNLAGASSGVISATFNYTGTVDFYNNTPQNTAPGGDTFSSFFSSNSSLSGPNYGISNYIGSGTLSYGLTQIADFSSLTGFLGSSGSAANYQYDALFKIDLGNMSPLTALQIAHDDGVSVYQNGVQIGGLTSAPTSDVTETATLTAGGDATLYYGFENGSPEVLQIQVRSGGQQQQLPEPTSMAVLATGLLGLGFMARRRSLRG